jgi:hypothetical protein
MTTPNVPQPNPNAEGDSALGLINVPEHLQAQGAGEVSPAAQPEIIDSVPGVDHAEVEAKIEQQKADRQAAEDRMPTYGGYSNIRSRRPGTMYQPGMPISINAPQNPKTGDPKIEKLTPPKEEKINHLAALQGGFYFKTIEFIRR